MRYLWEMFQNARIERGTATADQAYAKGHEAARRIRELEAEVDTLNLVVMAMWELFGKSNGLFLKDLEAKMREIDLRDGVLDGKMSRGEIDCVTCGRRLADRRKACIYCGTELVTPLGSNVENR